MSFFIYSTISENSSPHNIKGYLVEQLFLFISGQKQSQINEIISSPLIHIRESVFVLIVSIEN